jgi:hypothetical protein
MIDLDARYTVAGYRGIAFYLLGYADRTDLDGVEIETEPDHNFVIAVMVGDDRKHVVGTDELTLISEDDYCHECGQIGCHGDSIAREEIPKRPEKRWCRFCDSPITLAGDGAWEDESGACGCGRGEHEPGPPFRDIYED